MIERTEHVDRVTRLLARYPVVGVLGARQIGKTTLARRISRGWKGETSHFDLEDPIDLERLSDPRLALSTLRGLVVIDEIQRRPDLFPVLRVLADRRPRRARFLILGSASPDLLRQSSESLAGRIAYHELDGFALGEVKQNELGRLWLRGGFPSSFLERGEKESFAWRRQLVRTYLERDLPELGIRLSSTTLARFWSMLAHYHGQTWNASELGRSFGVADTTVRQWLDVLTSTFMVRQLSPWHENIGKRQVRAPRVFIADSGILHALLDIRTRRDLDRHPKLGASFEGFAIAQITHLLGIEPRDCHFWATHQGAELDLLVVEGRKRRGFEIKHTAAPSFTRSMRVALDDLKLDRLDVIHAGDVTFPLAPNVRAIALARVRKDLAR